MGHSRAGVEGGGLGGTEGERGKGFEKGGLAASRGKDSAPYLQDVPCTTPISVSISNSKRKTRREGGKEDWEVVRVREEEERDLGEVGWLQADEMLNEQKTNVYQANDHATQKAKITPSLRCQFPKMTKKINCQPKRATYVDWGREVDSEVVRVREDEQEDSGKVGQLHAEEIPFEQQRRR
eukprot:1151322-Pelagomonas_calceolata.AAC.1